MELLLKDGYKAKRREVDHEIHAIHIVAGRPHVDSGFTRNLLMQYIPGLVSCSGSRDYAQRIHPQVMRVQLALQTLSMFFIPAIAVYIMMLRSDSLGQDLRGSLAVKGHLGDVACRRIVFLVVTHHLSAGAWNASWAIARMESADGASGKVHDRYDSDGLCWSAFATNIFVCAFLPALAEELFFRGVLQSIFIRTLKNPHVANPIVAAVFSFFHFQLAGFVPRLVLGLLMDISFITGIASLAITAHFANNAVAVFAYFITTRYASAGVSPQMFDKYLEGFGILHVISMLLFAFLSFVFLRKIYLKS